MKLKLHINQIIQDAFNRAKIDETVSAAEDPIIPFAWMCWLPSIINL